MTPTNYDHDNQDGYVGEDGHIEGYQDIQDNQNHSDDKYLWPAILGVVTIIILLAALIYLARLMLTAKGEEGMAIALILVYIYFPFGGLCLITNLLCLKNLDKARYPVFTKHVNRIGILLYLSPVLFGFIISLLSPILRSLG